MVLIISVLIGVALDFAGAKPADTAVKYYASKYDHIDVEAILNNRRMVNYYAACMLSRGPCPPEGIEFKRILPEALINNCGRCTEKQATVAFHAIKRIRKEYPKIWNQLAEKWDPDESYIKKFESTFPLRKGGVKPPSEQPAVLSRFGESVEDNTADNNIGGSFSPATTTSHQDTAIDTVLTSTNSIPPSSIISTSTTTTTTDYPYPPYESTSLVSTTKATTIPSLSSTSTLSALPSFSTFTRPSTTTSSPSTTESTTSTTASIRSSTQSSTIPGLIPLNSFFTNTPARPFISLNIGANIGATVKAIRQVERIVAGVAMEKLGFIRNMLFPHLRKTRRKNS